MSECVYETRSFDSEELRDLDAWSDEGMGWDAVSTRALIHRVRWHTGLSQSEFAAVYGLDLDHLKALERGAVAPDRVLVAYLTVIDRAPETVRSALRTC